MPLNDRFAYRIGDPPNAGYSSRREKAASDWMQDICRALEREPPQGLGRDALLLIVSGGRDLWRVTAQKEMRGMLRGRALDDAIDELWIFFVKLAGPRLAEQLEQRALMNKWAPWQIAHGYHRQS